VCDIAEEKWGCRDMKPSSQYFTPGKVNESQFWQTTPHFRGAWQTGDEAGSYLRLIDCCTTQLKAQGPSRTCHESKKEEEEGGYGPLLSKHWHTKFERSSVASFGLSCSPQTCCQLLSHTKYFHNRFAEFNSPSNPLTYPSILLM